MPAKRKAKAPGKEETKSAEPAGGVGGSIATLLAEQREVNTEKNRVAFRLAVCERYSKAIQMSGKREPFGSLGSSSLDIQ